MKPLPPLYVPPLPAPFVGGDVSAGLAALLEADVPRPFVLADLGTNGELALVTETGQLWLTSVPLGPALEGIGPECGQLAGPGVVTGFTLTPLGLAAQFYESASPDAENAADAARHHAAQGAVCPCPACQSANAGQNPEGLAAGSAAGAGVGSAGAVARGISATGYLSLLALLLRAGALRTDGQFVANPAMPLARKLAAGLEQPNLAGEPPSSGQPRSGARLRLPHGLWLAAADVDLLRAVGQNALRGSLLQDGDQVADGEEVRLDGNDDNKEQKQDDVQRVLEQHILQLLRVHFLRIRHFLNLFIHIAQPDA